MRIDSSRILTIHEIALVVAHLRKRRRYRGNRTNLVIFRLATCLGLRASEIAGVTVGDVLLRPTKPILRIRKAVAKRRKARSVPLYWDAETLRDIEQHVAERLAEGASKTDPLVVSQTGHQMDRTQIRRRYITATKCLHRENITTHDGRHSFVSLALNGGRSLAEVQAAVGHASLATTGAYLHVVPDDGAVGSLFTA